MVKAAAPAGGPTPQDRTVTTSRREFLRRFGRTAGCFVASASLTPLVGCTQSRPTSGSDRSYSFPQGVASADPQADAVTLWTRVVSRSAKAEPIDLRLQLARDASFSEILLQEDITAESGLDHTVRCFVEGLEPGRRHFFRFLAPDDSVSRTGRTRTAPASDADSPLVAAVCSCQHYEQGFFSAYRRLLLDDQMAAGDGRIDLVIHVGDFIYEGSGGSAPMDLNGDRVVLTHANGTRRVLGPFPSGAENIARSLEDFRHLYRVYLSDPDLQEARAQFPFVYTWDDHELTNDYWQSFTTTQSLQRRKVDANQAWFEYMPAALSQATDGPAGFNPAQDFTRPETVDAPSGDFDEDFLSLEPNNLAAIRSVTIYRTLTWGRMADLLVVDGRSYRGPRGITTSLVGTRQTTYPAAPVPAALVRTLNGGRTAADGNPPETIEFEGRVVPNERLNAPRGSMLGAAQKEWLTRSLLQSAGRWQVICNNVPMMRFGFDMSFRAGGRVDDVWWTDSWDGYPLERQELMEFVRDMQLTNVVSVTGDRHAHFAGVVYDDFDGTSPRAVIPEFVGAGVSASCRLKALPRRARGDPDLEALIQFDGRQFGFNQGRMPALNAWLIYGAASALTLHDTGDAVRAREERNPAVNPHMSYADTDAYGYYVMQFKTGVLEAEFVSIEEPLWDYGEAGPPVRRRVRFTIPSWAPGEEPRLSRPTIEGDPPLMGLKEEPDPQGGDPTPA